LIPVVQEGITRRSTAASIRGDSGISANTLAASDGSSLVGFLQRGTGAVARTIQSRLRDTVSILDFIPTAEHAAIYNGVSTYDCSAALDAALLSVSANISNVYEGGPRVRFPPGHYYFASTIELKKSVILEGDSVGQAGGHTSLLRFAADTTGIIVHRSNTIGSGVESPATTGADASIIRNLELQGDRAGTSGHGIWLRARADIENVRISYFSENGLNIVASAASGGATEGNANNFHVARCRITNNGRHGVYIDGSDANAGKIDHVDCSANDGWGFYDSSFLGNHLDTCHTNGNGKRSQVSHGGSRYYVTSDSLGGTTEPGTESVVWVLIGVGGVSSIYPAWTFGGDYIQGGAYKTDSNNGHNGVLTNCYSEGSQPPSSIVLPWTIVCGLHGAGFTPGSSAFRINGDTSGGSVSAFQVPAVTGSSKAFNLRVCASSDEVMNLELPGDHPSGFGFMQWENGNGCWVVRHARLAARTPVRFTTDLNILAGGRSSAIGGGNVLFAQGLWIGGSTGTLRQHDSGTAAPTTGAHARGDIRWHSSPAAGGNAGWICTAAGTPGTWKAFGTIDP
jgi:hypothetical protein